jgi:CIC family chloride channel protein
MDPDVPTQRRGLASKLGLDRDWYLALLAAGIGVFTACVAMAFMELIHRGTHLIFENEQLPKSSLVWLIMFVPAAGGLLAGIIIYYMATEARGHGVPEVLDSIHRSKSRIQARVAIAKWLSAVFSIGSGGSAGAEGPIVQIGSALGSNVGRLIGANPQNTGTLLGCGAAAGIASVFNAPIAGIFFVLEILLRDFSVRTFTPIVIASVFSTATTQAIRGQNDPIFNLVPGFEAAAFTPWEIPNYLVLGLFAGFAAIAFVRALYWTEDLYERIKLHPIIKPVTGGLLLGVLGVLFVTLFPQTQAEPSFYSNGYPVIEAELLNPEFYASGSGETGLFVLLLSIAACKGIATCLTLGSGGSGGIFAPSLMLGAGVGGAFGVIVNGFDLAPHASPAHYALVGMAAVVAATTHAPLTAILIVYEITRSYQIILPLMLAAVISTVVARLIMRDSIYTLKLARRGIHVGAMSDLTILRRLTVDDVPLVAPVFVHPNESAQRLLELSERMSVSDFVVTDRVDHYLGLVTAGDLKEALVYREAIPLLQVSELQRSDLPTVMPDETLDRVLNKFARHDVTSLVVVDEQGDRKVLGLITRGRLMRRYQTALTRD